MELHGRGAWPSSGAGGTKKFRDETQPGPYYYLGSGSLDPSDSQDNFAVYNAVKAYQRALNRRLADQYEVNIDGIYGPKTVSAVTRFQSKRSDTLQVWGGIGPDTSKSILYPDLVKFVESINKPLITETIVSGLIGNESGWDAGAVGYVDPQDLGLAQINGPSHPDLTAEDRLRPLIAFEFVVNYLKNALSQLDNNQRDAIASYNLGIGGARRWIDQGRPCIYTPAGSSTSRDVCAYIERILQG